VLANETWELVSKNVDTNYKFNSFLDTFLKIFGASYPVPNKSLGKTRNVWITQGIKISCRHKGSLFLTEEVIIHTSQRIKINIAKHCPEL
jgi:hypothetical protein